MHAAVFHGPNNIAYEEVHYNQNDERGGVSLRVNACSVCSYDARVYRNGHKKVTPPIILGHEICGQIEKDLFLTDDSIQTTIKAGSRVVVSPIIPCLNCNYCHSKQYNLCINLKEIGSSVDGGFAEFVRIPEKVLKIGGLILVPDNLSDEEATLLEPLACCLSGFSHIGPITRGKETTVAIIGDGPIGLLHLQISKRLYGAKTIVIGKIPHRIRKAKLMGADATITLSGNEFHYYYYDNDPASSEKGALKDIFDLTEGVGANIIVVATSTPSAIGLAQKVASRNSIINLFAGMPKDNSLLLDPNWLHYNQITITGSFSSVPKMVQQAARLASSREIDLSQMISHRYPLAKIEKAILATERRDGLRVTIDNF